METRKYLFGVALGSMTLLIAACGGSNDKAPAATADNVVSITLGAGKEFALAADKQSIKAGSITFAVANKGTVGHEMIVVPLAAGEGVGALAAGGEANEDGSPGEVPTLDPGKTGSVTLDLKAGTYALICNEPGHFAGGMTTTLTVA